MSKLTNSGMIQALLHTGTWKHMVSSATAGAKTDAGNIQGPKPSTGSPGSDDPSDASDPQLNQKKVTI